MEDEEEAESDDESAEMTFRYEGAKVVLELDQRSDAVVVSMDCEVLDFSNSSDPAALIKAGVPQPRAYVFLQDKTPRPAEIQDVFYRSNACHFKSPLELQAAFDFYLKALKSDGWRESRKPIVTDDRRYTEFQRKGVELSVNIFSDEVGSRIILTYESDVKEPKIPPLAEVASSTPKKKASGEPDEPGQPDAPTADFAETVVVDVSKNTGVATVTLGTKKYAFKHVVAYRTKSDSEDTTQLFFCDRAIPLQKLQATLAKEDSVSISDLFTSGFPQYLNIQLNEYLSFSFNADGAGIGNSFEDPINDLKVENGRVQGTIKTREPMEFFDEKFSVSATIDAVIITSSTRVDLATAPIAARETRSPKTEVLLPEGAGNVQGEGSTYCKTTRADVDLPLQAVVEFYRKELTAKGWKEQKPAVSSDTPATLIFKSATGSMVVRLSGEGESTSIDAAVHFEAKAKQDGMLPEAGKGRILLANGHEKAVTIMIGKKSYPLKAGQGMEDPKKALNYTVAPGKYQLTIKVPGQPAKNESVEITANTTWGVFVLPTGEPLTYQIYWSADSKPE